MGTTVCPQTSIYKHKGRPDLMHRLLFISLLFQIKKTEAQRESITCPQLPRDEARI